MPIELTKQHRWEDSQQHGMLRDTATRHVCNHNLTYAMTQRAHSRQYISCLQAWSFSGVILQFSSIINSKPSGAFEVAAFLCLSDAKPRRRRIGALQPPPSVLPVIRIDQGQGMQRIYPLMAISTCVSMPEGGGAFWLGCFWSNCSNSSVKTSK